jgi:hypothetical protein
MTTHHHPLRTARVLSCVLALGAVGAAAYAGDVMATPPSGFSGNVLGPAPLGPLDVKVRATAPQPWRIKLRTHGLSDMYVADNLIAPGGDSGWHHHPGPSLIFVKAGTVTDYESSDPHCRGHVYGAGSAFVDSGTDVHLLRNNGSVEAETIAFQLVPRGAMRRIDADQPANCR